MSDDLRAALTAYETGNYSRLEGGAVIQMFADTVRAYLAEHPADDGEAVTEDWLRAVGCVWQDWGGWRNERLSLWRHVGGWCVDVNHSLPMHRPTLTRGDVRLLLAALGVSTRGTT